jgi:hypothetical protein
MPAVTVDDITTLARVTVPGSEAVQRPVVSMTTAPQGLLHPFSPKKGNATLPVGRDQ